MRPTGQSMQKQTGSSAGPQLGGNRMAKYTH